MSQAMHMDFSRFLAVEKNKRLAATSSKFVPNSHMTYITYFEGVGKLKNLTQWRARLLAIGIKVSVVMSVKTTAEAGRVVALKYMSLTEPEKIKFKLDTAEFVAADNRRKDHWITPELTEWFANEAGAEA